METMGESASETERRAEADRLGLIYVPGCYCCPGTCTKRGDSPAPDYERFPAGSPRTDRDSQDGLISCPKHKEDCACDFCSEEKAHFTYKDTWCAFCRSCCTTIEGFICDPCLKTIQVLLGCTPDVAGFDQLIKVVSDARNRARG